MPLFRGMSLGETLNLKALKSLVWASGFNDVLMKYPFRLINEILRN
jgi:hypothetical protein